MDLAASIQAVTEEAVLRIGRHARDLKRAASNLVLAGGVALNCVANGRLLREGDFDDIWIQPAAGDAGGSLGAALFVWYQLLDKPRQPEARMPSKEASSARVYATEQVARFLSRQGRRRPAVRRRERACRPRRRICWPTARLSAGSRAGWSLAQSARWRGAFWATLARRPCRRP